MSLLRNEFFRHFKFDSQTCSQLRARTWQGCASSPRRWRLGPRQRQGDGNEVRPALSSSSRARRLQRNSRLGLIPCRRATAEMFTPGRATSTTIACFSASLHRRRASATTEYRRAKFPRHSSRPIPCCAPTRTNRSYNQRPPQGGLDRRNTVSLASIAYQIGIAKLALVTSWRSGSGRHASVNADLRATGQRRFLAAHPPVPQPAVSRPVSTRRHQDAASLRKLIRQDHRSAESGLQTSESMC